MPTKKETTEKTTTKKAGGKRPNAGRPLKEFNTKAFVDLIGLGCTQEEICWFFRDKTGKPANIDTLSRWCKRTFDMNFQEYAKQNSYMALKIKLRRNQFALSEKNASMAIWLGKQYLGQRDTIEIEDKESLAKLDEILKGLAQNATGIKPETE